MCSTAHKRPEVRIGSILLKKSQIARCQFSCCKTIRPTIGTVICLLQNTVALEPFYANKQAQFDAVKFSWLGTPTTEVAVYMVWHSSKIKTLQDAQTYEMMTGGAGS